MYLIVVNKILRLLGSQLRKVVKSERIVRVSTNSLSSKQNLNNPIVTFDKGFCSHRSLQS